jgi:hypothetical protein
VAAPKVKLMVRGSPTSPPPAQVVSLVGHGYPRTLHINERRALTLAAKLSDGTEREIKEGMEWESSDANVLNISAKGEVVALKDGRATVAATYQGFKSEPVSIEVRGKGAKEPRSRAPANAAPPAAPLEDVVPRQPTSVKQPPEEPAALSPDPGKVITDYIRGEKQRRSKSGR